MNKTRKNLSVITIALVLFALYGYIGSMAMEDEINAERDYCQRVADGVHGHYRDGVSCPK